jgi:hypothetical protein
MDLQQLLFLQYDFISGNDDGLLTAWTYKSIRFCQKNSVLSRDGNILLHLQNALNAQYMNLSVTFLILQHLLTQAKFINAQFRWGF